MLDVEQIGRFHAPKYLSCYADLLSLALGEDDALRQSFPDINMMLELGVSRITDFVDDDSRPFSDYGSNAIALRSCR
jgi:hypothetical protein